MTDIWYPDTVIDGVPVVATLADIDITSADALGSALLKAAANGPGTLVVDMTQTQFCDSSGMHTLFDAHKRARDEGREVLLVIPAAAVLRIFAITGMDQVIPIFASMDEALAEAAAAANGAAAGKGEMACPGPAGPA